MEINQPRLQFNPLELVNILLKNLLKREQEVLRRRFALDGKDRETLEKIGRNYDITRERVRQIELSGLKKIKTCAREEIGKSLEVLEMLTDDLLKEHGGLMLEQRLVNNLYLNEFSSEIDDLNRQNLLFIMSYLLENNWHKVDNDPDFEPFWHLKTIDIEIVRTSINHIIGFLNDHGAPLPLNELLDELRTIPLADNDDKLFLDHLKTNYYIESAAYQFDPGKVVVAHLDISKKTDKNILERWGLKEWNQIVPKRMNDKIYLVLKKEKRPLHFTEIAEKINEANFDKKIAYPATVHNELILDKKYILVGRGVYALREWGYNDGTVSQVIRGILEKEQHTLSKQEIIDKVLSQRLVRKTTILLSLANRDLFTKTEEGEYILATKQQNNKTTTKQENKN